MVKKKITRNGKMDMTCFVLIGSGMKTDYSTGRTLNLDLTYTKLIKPAFDNVGIRCFRAIDVNATGGLDKLMYYWLYHADFVIADLSTMNAGVFYALGVRHAQRPNTTLLMAENGLFKRLPFDLSLTVIYGYEHLGEDIAEEEAVRFVGLLSSQVQKLLDTPLDEDSPVYIYMPGMKPPEWTDPVGLIEELEMKLAVRNKYTAAAAVQAASVEKPEIDVETIQKQALSIILDNAEAAMKRRDFPTAIALFRTAAEHDPQDRFLWQRLVLVTYKNKERDFDFEDAIEALREAEQILIDHCELYASTDPETLGLAGAVYKRLYERTDDIAYFEKSVYCYERGFYIKQDYYTGIHVAFMYTQIATELAEVGNTFDAIVYYGHANLIRKKVAEICLNLVNSESFASRGDKEWVYLTLYEAYFGRESYDEAKEYMPFIVKHASDFALSFFEDHKAKLTEIMERFKSNVLLHSGDGRAASPTAPVEVLQASVGVSPVLVSPVTRRAPSDLDQLLQELIWVMEKYKGQVQVSSEETPKPINIPHPPQASTEKEPEGDVYISYAWSGESEEIVDELDHAFQQKKITIMRDKRDMEYKDKIKTFMKKIGEGKCVILVISQKYLESENCMFELLHVAENKDFHARIFPIVLDDAKIYKPIERIKYIKHWEEQRDELDEAMKSVSSANMHGFREDIDLYDDIRDTIAQLTDMLKDMNTFSTKMHRASGFAELIEAVEARLTKG